MNDTINHKSCCGYYLELLAKSIFKLEETISTIHPNASNSNLKSLMNTQQQSEESEIPQRASSAPSTGTPKIPQEAVQVPQTLESQIENSKSFDTKEENRKNMKVNLDNGCGILDCLFTCCTKTDSPPVKEVHLMHVNEEFSEFSSSSDEKH